MNSYELPLTDGNGKPAESLLKLLKLTEVEHDGSWPSILEGTQTKWYRAGMIRAEIEFGKYEHLKPELLPLLRELGLVDAVHAPKGSRFRYAVLLGATATAVFKRLIFLFKEWYINVGVDGIVLLGSERPVSPQEYEKLLQYVLKDKSGVLASHYILSRREWPTNEIEAMRRIYNGTLVPWHYTAIGVPLIDGRNPNTSETLRAWLRIKRPAPGSYLMVSSQPFVSFQELVAAKTLPTGFSVTAIGYEAPDDMLMAKHLDNLAKLIFEVADSLGVRK